MFHVWEITFTESLHTTYGNSCRGYLGLRTQAKMSFQKDLKFAFPTAGPVFL